MEDIRVIFSNNLRKLAEKKPCRQKELSEVIGVPDTTVSAWFTGRYMPEWDRISPIAEFFGVRVCQLFDAHGLDETRAEGGSRREVKELRRELAEKDKELQSFKQGFDNLSNHVKYCKAEARKEFVDELREDLLRLGVREVTIKL